MGGVMETALVVAPVMGAAVVFGFMVAHLVAVKRTDQILTESRLARDRHEQWATKQEYCKSFFRLQEGLHMEQVRNLGLLRGGNAKPNATARIEMSQARDLTVGDVFEVRGQHQQVVSWRMSGSEVILSTQPVLVRGKMQPRLTQPLLLAHVLDGEDLEAAVMRHVEMIPEQEPPPPR